MNFFSQNFSPRLLSHSQEILILLIFFSMRKQDLAKRTICGLFYGAIGVVVRYLLCILVTFENRQKHFLDKEYKRKPWLHTSEE